MYFRITSELRIGRLRLYCCSRGHRVPRRAAHHRARASRSLAASPSDLHTHSRMPPAMCCSLLGEFCVRSSKPSSPRHSCLDRVNSVRQELHVTKYHRPVSQTRSMSRLALATACSTVLRCCSSAGKLSVHIIGLPSAQPSIIYGDCKRLSCEESYLRSG